jgi:hypothetical protein
MFKLKNQFNIDSLESFQEFNIERKYKAGNKEKMTMLKCKIIGIHTTKNNCAENYQDTGFPWVKVEGCESRLEEKQIIDWLSHFGEVKSEISEDTHEGSDDSSDDHLPGGNGIYSVRMKLERDMPQLMPMHGKKDQTLLPRHYQKMQDLFWSPSEKELQQRKGPMDKVC